MSGRYGRQAELNKSLLLLSILYMASLGLVCPSAVHAVGTSVGTTITVGGDGGSPGVADQFGDVVGTATSMAGNDTKASVPQGGPVSVTVEAIYGDTMIRTSAPDTLARPGDTVWFDMSVTNAGNSVDTLGLTAFDVRRTSTGVLAFDSVIIVFWNAPGTAPLNSIVLPPDGAGSFKVSVFVKPLALRKDTLAIQIKAIARNGAGGDTGGYVGNNGVIYAGNGDDTAFFAVPVINLSPIADAGPPDTFIMPGDTVYLSGAASFDPDPTDALTYSWAQETGAFVTLLPNTAVSNPSFASDTSFTGKYVFRLTVTDPYGDSSVDTIEVNASNAPPFANAGLDTSVRNNDTATLNGAGSSDLNGDTLGFLWIKTSGPACAINNATSAVANVFMTNKGVYQFMIRVNDAFDTSYDTVQLTVLNTKPVADAGPPSLNRPNNDTTLLFASGSIDPDAGDTLTYAWSLDTGPTAPILNSGSETAMVYMILKGTYTFRLTVNDGLDSSIDSIQITVLNTPPFAEAGPPSMAVSHKDTVTLSAASSFDPDTGDTLTYNWVSVSGGASFVPDPSVMNPQFAANTIGTYVIRLDVNDGIVTSSDTIVVVADNVPPIADAGPDTTIVAGGTVFLNGTASFDSGGQSLTYLWTQFAGPTRTLSPGVTSPNPSFVMDSAFVGDYVFLLFVNDGYDTSTPDTVIINAGNVPPVSNAGPDTGVRNNDTSVLSGAGSYDVDGDTLHYFWSKLSGPSCVITGASNVVANVYFSIKGVYVFQLRVDDGFDTSFDAVEITVLNTPPVAEAGPPSMAVSHKDTVTLSAASSFDPDTGDTLTYNWVSVSGGASFVPDPSVMNPQFAANTIGTYVIRLDVNDGIVTSSDTIVVVANNVAPIANAGPDTTLPAGGMVTLDGSASFDSGGQALTYLWTQMAGSPLRTLSPPATSVTPGFFTDTNFRGSYVFILVVNDGYDTSQPDTVIVSCSNVIPIANAGPDSSIVHPDTVMLSGALSSDLNGDTLTYAWTQIGGLAVSLSDSTVVNPSFYAAKTDTYIFQLRVFDGIDTSMPSTVRIVSRNTPPLANAGFDTSVASGVTVTLNGSASGDSNGDVLSFLWTQNVGDSTLVTLSDSTVVNPSFIPTIAGMYTFSLRVGDGVDTLYDNVNIIVGPAAPARVGFLTDTHVLVNETGMVTIRVVIRDANGNVVPNEMVAFTQTHPGTMPISSPAMTDMSGQAQIPYTPGYSSSFYRVQARVVSTGASQNCYVYGNKLDILGVPDDTAHAGQAWRMWSPNRTPTPDGIADVIQDDLGSNVKVYEWRQASDVVASLGSSRYYTPDHIVRGRAYWIKDAEGGQLDVDGTAPTTAETVTVTMAPGWNQVGSGQFYFVDWGSGVRFSRAGDTSGPWTNLTPQAAADSGLIKNAIYWWDESIHNYHWGPDTSPTMGGSLFPSVQMKPMAGFWFKAETTVAMTVLPKPADPIGAVQILNQAPKYLSSAFNRQGRSENVASEANWAIQLMAKSSNVEDPQNYVGVMPTAAAARTASLFEPPAVASGYMTMGIRDADNIAAPIQAASYAAPITTAKAWSVEIYSDLDAPVTISWDNLSSVPDQYQMYLLTPTGMVDLRKTSSVTIAASAFSAQHVSLTLAVGLSEFIGAFLAAPLSKDLTFVYPNPGPDASGNMYFKHNVTTGDVKIKIFDVGGRLVKELGGTSPIQWDTTNRFGQRLGSGVYIYIIEAGGNRLVDKLAIVR